MKYIKLFENIETSGYRIYDIITMPSWKAIDIVGNEIKKNASDFRLIGNILEHSKIDVNDEDIEGYTLLYLACAYDKPKIVKILLDIPNVDVNAVESMLM